MSVEDLCAAAIAAGQNCRVAFDTGPVDQIGGLLAAVAIVGVGLIIGGTIILGMWIDAWKWRAR